MALQQGATDAFKTGLANGAYNFSTDSFKIALYTGSATLGPDTAVYTNLNEVVATGYSAGGIALPVSPTVCVLDFGSDKTSTISLTVQFPTANSSNAILRIA